MGQQNRINHLKLVSGTVADLVRQQNDSSDSTKVFFLVIFTTVSGCCHSACLWVEKPGAAGALRGGISAGKAVDLRLPH